MATITILYSPTALELDVYTVTIVSFSGAGAMVTQAVKFSPSSTDVGEMLSVGPVRCNYTTKHHLLQRTGVCITLL